MKILNNDLFKELNDEEIDFIREIAIKGKPLPYYAGECPCITVIGGDEFHKYSDNPVYSQLYDKKIIGSVQSSFNMFELYTREPYTIEKLNEAFNLNK